MSFYMQDPKVHRSPFVPGTVNPMKPGPLTDINGEGPTFVATDGLVYPVVYPFPGVQGLGDPVSDLLGASLSPLLSQAIDDNWPKIDANAGKTISKYTTPVMIGLGVVGLLSATALVMVILHERKGLRG